MPSGRMLSPAQSVRSRLNSYSDDNLSSGVLGLNDS